MTKKLEGETAVVTGVGRGIDKAEMAINTIENFKYDHSLVIILKFLFLISQSRINLLVEQDL